MSATCDNETVVTSGLDSTVTAERSRRPGGWHVWRVVASGIAFTQFMVSSLVFALFIFPPVRFFTRSNEEKGRRVRHLIQVMFTLFLKTWKCLGIMRPAKVAGLESLRSVGPCIIVANHPTLIDAVLMGTMVPDFNCVVKHALRDHFFLGGTIRAAGYVSNDEPLQVIRLCGEGFRRGQSLVIFPEGSRSPKNGLRPFSRGAAQLALRSGVPLIPAVIRCDPPSLMKHQRWYDVPERPFELSITFHPALVCDPVDMIHETLPVKARRYTGQIEEFFRAELSRDRIPAPPETL